MEDGLRTSIKDDSLKYSLLGCVEHQVDEAITSGHWPMRRVRGRIERVRCRAGNAICKAGMLRYCTISSYSVL